MTTDVLIMGGAGGAILIVICLIAREQTESRIRGLRTELMSLRSKEKRLATKRDEIEGMRSQMREAILRTGRYQHELQEASKRFREELNGLHLALRGVELPDQEEANKDPEKSEA